MYLDWEEMGGTAVCAGHNSWELYVWPLRPHDNMYVHKCTKNAHNSLVEASFFPCAEEHTQTPACWCLRRGGEGSSERCHCFQSTYGPSGLTIICKCINAQKNAHNFLVATSFLLRGREHPHIRMFVLAQGKEGSQERWHCFLYSGFHLD